MASNVTEHYGLSQWESGDAFLREEFNEDHRKVDAALAGKCEVVFGAYYGVSGENHAWVDISVGFRPKAVLVVSHDGTNPYYLMNVAVQLATEDCPAECLEITETGFQVRGGLKSKGSGQPYHYILFR